MVKGPTKIPIGPKSEIPPKTENKIKRGCSFTLLPTIIGFKILSMVPMSTIPQTASPRAPSVFPVSRRNIIAGTVTSPLPTVGTNAVTMATNPHNAGLGTPKIENPIPASVP